MGSLFKGQRSPNNLIVEDYIQARNKACLHFTTSFFPFDFPLFQVFRHEHPESVTKS